MPERSERPAAPAWLRPPAQQSGLKLYVEVVRERLWLILAAVVVTVGVAVAYLALADKVYEAEASLLVTPVSEDNPALADMPLIRDASDPTRPVETVAELTMSVDVAARAGQELGLDRSPTSLLEDVSAAPVAASSVVAITATGSTPEEAAGLANAFATGVVAERTDVFHEELDRRIEQLEGSGSGTGAVPGESLESEISRLEFLRSGDGPEVRVEAEAQLPTAAVSPKPRLTLAAALLAGIVLGIAVAFAAQTLDPRLRREEQLRNRYSLPILARVPPQTTTRRSRRRAAAAAWAREAREATGAAPVQRKKTHPLMPTSVSPGMREAYRTLRANVAVAGRGLAGSRSILVTGSAPSEGKTTTALNLAASFALAGNRVILIEADLRRPAIGDALGVEVRKGIVSILLEDVPLRDALTTHPAFGPDLQLLLAEKHGGSMSELFFLRAAQQLVEEAQGLADYVIIDSPPLTAVVDTLPLARQADEVVIVARLGVTRLNLLQELGELLASNDIEPLGFALLGAPHATISAQYYWDSGAAQDFARDAGTTAGAKRRADPESRQTGDQQQADRGQDQAQQGDRGQGTPQRRRRRRAGPVR